MFVLKHLLHRMWRKAKFMLKNECWWMIQRKDLDALMNRACLTKWSNITAAICQNITAIYWWYSHLWFENRTDWEAVLEIMPLNLPPEIGHMLERALIHQMKEKLLLLSRFLFSVRWKCWLLLRIFLKNIIAVGQNWKVQNDSCNLRKFHQ